MYGFKNYFGTSKNYTLQGKRGTGKNSAGFTLIEILVVLGVSIIILLFSFSAFSSFYKKTDLDTSRDDIISTLKAAKNRTLASEQANQYGVYFDTSTTPNQYVFFQGQSYISRNNVFDEIHKLSPTIEIASYDFEGAIGEVVYNRLDGKTLNFGNIVIRSKKNNETKIIYIYPSGEISNRAESISGPGLISDSRHTHFDLGWDMSGATILRFNFINVGAIEEVSIADYFSFEGFDWSGGFTIGGAAQNFTVHSHKLIPSTVLCIHRDRNNGNNNQEVYIYLVHDGLEKEIAHYDDDAQATVYKGNYVWGEMEKQ